LFSKKIKTPKLRRRRTRVKEQEKTDVFLKAFLRSLKKFLRNQVDALGLGNNKYKR